MREVQDILSAFPNEKELKNWVETPELHLLLDESENLAKRLGSILSACSLFKAQNGESPCLLVSSSYEGDIHFQKTLFSSLSLEQVSWVDFSSDAQLLTALLGADALFTDREDSLCASLARRVYLPVICLSGEPECRLTDGCFAVEDTAPSVAAVMELLKERKYDSVLSGYEDGKEKQ